MGLHTLLDIGLSVPDPEALAAFWVRRGLIHRGDGVLGTQDRPVQLTVTDGAYRRLSDLHLGCDDEQDLHATAKRLTSLGVPSRLVGTTLSCVDPIVGHTVRVEACAPPPLAPARPVARNTPGSRTRIDARSEAIGARHPRAPRRLGHLTLGTNQVQELTRFYVEGVGFKPSDLLERGAGGTFARCSTDHHNLLVMSGRTSYLNHYAFEMDDVDAIGRAAADLLAEAPAAHVVGLGRHVVGSNFYWYFLDPAGTTFELFADMDTILDDDAWRPILRDDWDGRFAVWGPSPPKWFFDPPDLGAIARHRRSERATGGVDGEDPVR